MTNKLREIVEYIWIWTLIHWKLRFSRITTNPSLMLLSFYTPLFIGIALAYWTKSTLYSTQNILKSKQKFMFRGSQYRALHRFFIEQNLHSLILEEIGLGLLYRNGALEFFDIDQYFNSIKPHPTYLKWSSAEQTLHSHRLLLLTSSNQIIREAAKLLVRGR